MKKIYMSIMIGMLLITLVSAGVLTLTALTPVTFDKPVAKALPAPEQITFDCGKELGVIIDGNEPDGKYDDNDLQSAIRMNCSDTITNIKMGGLTYKQNKYGIKSFDETYLKTDECQRDGNYFYDNTCNTEQQIIEEIGEIKF